MEEDTISERLYIVAMLLFATLPLFGLQKLYTNGKVSRQWSSLLLRAACIHNHPHPHHSFSH
jgi:hypothetical protein